MKASILFGLSAVLAIVFGTVLVLAPVEFLDLFGIVVGEGGKLVSQLFGASLWGFAFIAWSSRDAPDSQARQATIYGMLVGVGTDRFALSGRPGMAGRTADRHCLDRPDAPRQHQHQAHRIVSAF